MKMLTFSERTLKEILRDPLTLAFGLGFPVVLLLLFSAIQANVPVSLFEIEVITPGITVFGLTFISLFSALLIAKDRESAFLQRLFTTPLSSADFIFGYALPLVPVSVVQCVICYLVAFMLGLKPTVNIVYAVLFIIPIALFFIGFGLMCGSVLSTKQVGGVCGALFTNLSAWLSGIWFDIDLVGSAFKKIAYTLPFVHACELEKAVLAGTTDGIGSHFAIVLGYTVFICVLAVLLFMHSIKKQ